MVHQTTQVWKHPLSPVYLFSRVPVPVSSQISMSQTLARGLLGSRYRAVVIRDVRCFVDLGDAFLGERTVTKALFLAVERWSCVP